MSIALPTFEVSVVFSAGANPAAWSLGNSPFPVTLGEPLLDIYTDVNAANAMRSLTVSRGKSRELDQF